MPAGTFAESDGTLVNSEGRAQRFFQVFVPAGHSGKLALAPRFELAWAARIADLCKLSTTSLRAMTANAGLARVGFRRART